MDKETKYEQSLETHLCNVTKFAMMNCPISEIEHLLWLACSFHDLGKLGEFQTYMKEVLKYGDKVRKRHIDHSSMGGLALGLKTFLGKSLAGRLTSWAIYSHHGLQDCIDWDSGKSLWEHRQEKVMDECLLNDYIERVFQVEQWGLIFRNGREEGTCLNKKLSQFAKEIGKGSLYGKKEFYLGMYARLLLSLLIDSDWSDSAAFSEQVPLAKRLSNDEIMRLWDEAITHFEGYMRRLGKGDEASALDAYRREISDICYTEAQSPKNLYRLTVPTGAGKTLSSLRFALYHARKYHRKHIIYAAPFNSLLEQNAQDIRKAVGNGELVLEYHCNVVHEDAEEEEKYRRLTENWDVPIVATTMVQLLNTLFSGDKSCIRRMHYLCNSVIIFDEVQAIPVRCVALFNLAVNFLTKFCGTTAILCSATQPSLSPLKENQVFEPYEMVANFQNFDKAFRRTVIKDRTGLVVGGMQVHDLVNFALKKLKMQKSVLIIVNTKECARTVFDALSQYCGSAVELYHLSTNMCAKNRQEVLAEIKEKTGRDRKEEQPVICVSTQLVEAGVNFSFASVIRSMAGLDSVIQAAGRCNRHKECNDICEVDIVKMSDEAENLTHLDEIRNAQKALETLLDFYRRDPEVYDGRLDSQKAIKKYYDLYFCAEDRKSQLTYPASINDVQTSLVDLLSDNPLGKDQYERCHNGKKAPMLCQAFKTAGDCFKVIEEDEKEKIIIPYDDVARAAIDRLEDPHFSVSEQQIQLRKLQIYSVGISRSKKEKLGNAVHLICEGKVAVLSEDYYDRQVGVLDTPKLNQLLY